MRSIKLWFCVLRRNIGPPMIIYGHGCHGTRRGMNKNVSEMWGMDWKKKFPHYTLERLEVQVP